MIIGIGTDIVKIDRISKIMKRTPNFIKGTFTEEEISYFEMKKNNPETIAGAFAVKEALSKALGTGVRGFRLKDIELRHDNLGKPYVVIDNSIRKAFGLNKCKIHVSISHSREDAVAFVIIEEGV
ncbi:holo-ACP synthase [Clostridium vincentii]|uniref:Holo-[acyl-carrier-protein] synthase n=1 Tax=Clostridium vincentii TaxID=52704 RepID=A0A2T0BKE0_9CLOT|nr:holo-ACP synthase [Clostridium vincentii]PRR84272.1 Holo-[acyl-carrier-protein] synthase [Clostridium vincentii]